MFWKSFGISVALGALVSGCNLTAAQKGALVCALASDGVTVTAIYAPKAAPKAGATSTVVCDGATQVGQILGSGK